MEIHVQNPSRSTLNSDDLAMMPSTLNSGESSPAHQQQQQQPILPETSESTTDDNPQQPPAQLPPAAQDSLDEDPKASYISDLVDDSIAKAMDDIKEAEGEVAADANAATDGQVEEEVAVVPVVEPTCGENEAAAAEDPKDAAAAEAEIEVVPVMPEVEADSVAKPETGAAEKTVEEIEVAPVETKANEETIVDVDIVKIPDETEQTTQKQSDDTAVTTPAADGDANENKTTTVDNNDNNISEISAENTNAGTVAA